MLALLPILLLVAQSDTPAGAEAPHGRRQVFIAPSGEPFRAYGDGPYPVAQWFAAADKNNDGKLDLAEFEADFLRFFDQLDVNHDGAVDGIEKTRYETTVVPETMGGSSFAANPDEEAEQGDSGGTDESAAKAKPRYGSNPIGAARYDLLGLPEPVAAMDTELRGRISRGVAEQAARERFALLDENHRGYLTLDALPPTYAEPGGRRRKR